MSEPIKAGDLVMVVKPSPCCGGTRAIGDVFIVAKLQFLWFNCRCGAQHDFVAFDAADGLVAEVCRLKKIDPPATGELDRVPVRKKEPVS